ncbi:MAG: RidA family protein [Halomonas sp.]|nr:RidA family protein [Halomonas sp.]MCC5883031.1 RidA family protein [Halomonas sp.]
MHRFRNDPTLAVPVFPGSHIATDGHYIFLCGLTVTDIQGGEAVLGDIAEETRWVMRRLTRMLEYAGASMADVVRVDIHLTNLDTIHTMDAAYAEFFEEKRYPARTCTESLRLSGGSNVEITLVARQPENSDG